jgi:cytochrome c6
MKSMTKLLIVAGLLCATACLVNAEEAAANWTKHCASCHGKDGAGKTTMGKKKGARDYTSAADQAKFSDAEATAAIKDGVKDKMKGYSDKLSDDEIKALVAYVRALKK